MKNFISLLFATFLIISLNSCNTVIKKSDEIIIIFNNPVDQTIFRDSSDKIILQTFPKEYISYFNSSGSIKKFLPQGISDTLTIKTNKRNYIEISHQYNCFEDIYFYIATGDTVTFTYYQNNYPYLTSSLSKQNEFLYNIETNMPGRSLAFNLGNYTLLTNRLFRNVYLTTKNEGNVPERYKNLYVPLDDVKTQFDTYCNIYSTTIDSLYKNRIIDDNLHKYYTLLSNFRQIKLKSNILSRETFQDKIQALDSEYKMLFDDMLLNNMSYRNFINSYISLLSLDPNIKSIKTENKIYNDSRAFFDIVSNKKEIPLLTKRELLFSILNDIFRNFGVDDKEAYSLKYSNITSDTSRVNDLLDQNKIDFDNSDKLLLLDVNNNKTTLDAILSKYKGKVIYIDFWASWCAPCRESMPNALKLREEYKNRDIVFIYLAKDDTQKPWLKAISDLSLNNNCDNYLITNSKSSKILDELKVGSIPHYLIFDKKGQLVHDNAPGPGNELIRKELNELLK